MGERLLKNVLIAAAPVVCVLFALFCGRYVTTPDQVGLSVVQWVYGGAGCIASALFGLQLPESGISVDPYAYTLIVEVRLPRAIAAAAVGGALAASGAAYQGVFRNPLVNPGLLGVSNGAGFGAALAIVVLGGGLAIYPAAFAFGIAAVALSYWIARVYRQAPAIMLILGGTIVSSVFAALVSLMKQIADTDTQLPSIVYWLMGSLSAIGWPALWALVPIAIGVVTLLVMAWRINVLSMGDKEAASLGVEVGRDKAVIVSGATLATAGAVCMAGVVGWVGLIIPHIGRMLEGSDNRRLIPCSFALGAAFLVLVDIAARCLWEQEVALGILTALIGAPFFVYLLKKTKGGVWQ